MKIEEIPDTVRAIAERAGMDDDELQALAAYSCELETEHMLDQELGLGTPEIGRDAMMAAERDLKSRGIVLADATQEQLLDALVRVSP
jgi:hypothetical protein